MHNECQKIFIAEVVSLILLDKLTMKQNGTVVLIAQIIANLKLFQRIQLIHFYDCIHCDLTIKELIRLIKRACANRQSKSS